MVRQMAEGTGDTTPGCRILDQILRHMDGWVQSMRPPPGQPLVEPIPPDSRLVSPSPVERPQGQQLVTQGQPATEIEVADGAGGTGIEAASGANLQRTSREFAGPLVVARNRGRSPQEMVETALAQTTGETGGEGDRKSDTSSTKLVKALGGLQVVSEAGGTSLGGGERPSLRPETEPEVPTAPERTSGNKRTKEAADKRAVHHADHEMSSSPEVMGSDPKKPRLEKEPESQADLFGKEKKKEG